MEKVSFKSGEELRWSDT